jgi:hypothetical protein
MKKMLLLICGLAIAFVIATVLAADRKSDVPPAQPEIAELKRQISALKGKLKALEGKVDKLEQSKNAPVANSPRVLVIPRNGQQQFILPGHNPPISSEFADPAHPPKIWGEGECNGWKYYMIPLKCETAAN